MEPEQNTIDMGCWGFLIGGTYCSIITIEKDGEIIEEYNMGGYL